ncbi:MAG: biotin-dependent carboxyltransferase family protein [Acidimicrobiales bacterium]|nr:biotin-dependent carboxyltransferase family protein [Acidimicrobiales bacterium]MCB9394557.1 biotin-dependent carboxyltransferase family protein [Acidimicrobiaceae bacterium]
MTALDVLAWGIAGSVRDTGRRGLAHLGRSRGGAVDLASLELGNRLVGNPVHVAGLESSGGLVLRTRRPVLVAVTGSPCDVTVVDGPPLGWGAPVALPSDATVRIGRLHGGARSYVCVRGGVVAVDGDRLDVGADPGTEAASQPAVPPRLEVPVRVWPGPRLDWFARGALDALVAGPWTVSVTSDRVGVRLDGPSLVRVRHGELPSEGMVEGAIQVPPDGRPIVMLADHPATGGYPVVAVVDPADLWLVAQRPPGSEVRFTRPR